jgi:RHS repeat-associated protein
MLEQSGDPDWSKAERHGQMPGREFSQEEYRYGFQGQETDKEWLGGAVSYKYRVHDARIGRFLSVDPLAPDYPWNSPYAFSENRVIDGVELEGLERISYLFMLDEETCEVACIGISTDYEVQERILELSVYNTKVVLLAFDDFEYTDFERPQNDPNVAPIQDFNNYVENRGTFDDYDNLEEFADAYLANIYGKKNKTNTYHLQIPFQEFSAPISTTTEDMKDAFTNLALFAFEYSNYGHEMSRNFMLKQLANSILSNGMAANAFNEKDNEIVTEMLMDITGRTDFSSSQFKFFMYRGYVDFGNNFIPAQNDFVQINGNYTIEFVEKK